MSFDIAESVALEWAIASLIAYETLLSEVFAPDIERAKKEVKRRVQLIRSGVAILEEC